MRQFRRLLIGSAAPLLLLLAQSGGANSQAITGGLHALVTGTNGAPIAGAQVKIISQATGAQVNTVTDNAGQFTAESLSVAGGYTVTVNAPGYPAKVMTDVGLSLGTTINMDIDLASAQVETVTVTGEHVTAHSSITAQAGVGTTFSATDIRNTPTIERDVRDVVQNTPYAYIDPVGGGSSPPVPTVNIAGANPRCNNFLVDGLQQKDSFGLNSTGYPTTRAPIPTDWAEQIQVAVTPYDVQYNDTCGGVVNLVTKSGGNTLHGTLYGYMKNDGLNGSDYNTFNNNTGQSQVTNATTRPIKPYFDEKSYGGTLSGAVIPDTLFFFVGYDELKRTSSPSGIAVGPNGSGYANTATTISQAEVNAIVADAQNVYGFNAGSFAATNPEYNQRYIGKLTWNINDDQALTGTYQHVAGAQVVTGTGGTTSTSGPRVSLPSNWYANAQKMEVYNLQETARWSNDLTTEVSIGHEGVHELPTALDGLNFPEVYVRTPGGDGVLNTSDDGYVRLGPDFSRQYNALYYRNDYIKALANYTLEGHTLEGGIEFHELHVDDKFVQGANGVVRFDSESDFANRIISTQILSASNGVNTSTSNAQGNPIYFATGTGGNPSAADGVFSYGVSSVFAQDTWYPMKDMTMLFGVRYDRYSANRNGIVANPYFQQRYGITNTLTVNGLDAALPRLSVTYNYTPAQDFIPGTVFAMRAGVGMYSGGFQNVWITNDYDTNGINLLNVTGIPGQGAFASVSNIFPTSEAAFQQELINGPLKTATTAQSSAVDAQLPNFKLPRSRRVNLGFDTFFGDGLLGPNWQFGFDYLSISAYDSPYWTNLRVQKTGGTAPDGRALYSLKFDGTLNKDPVTGGQLTGSDYAMGSANGGNSTLFIASIKNSWKDTGYGDFDVSLAYTHERTTDIQSAVASTASTNYNNIARVNFNDPEVGRSDYERPQRFSLNVNITEKFFGDLETRFNIFGQRMSGQHYSLNFNPSGNPFLINPATGVNLGQSSGARSLLYVPKVDPSTGMVTASSDPLVAYAAGFDFASFNAILKQSGALKYAGGIAPRNAFSAPWTSLLNLSVEQELAGFNDTHRLVFVGDIYNVLNLINPAWGADTTAVYYQADPLVNATIVNGKYVYSAPQTLSGFNGFTFQTQRAASTYQIQFGVRYEF